MPETQSWPSWKQTTENRLPHLQTRQKVMPELFCCLCLLTMIWRLCSRLLCVCDHLFCQGPMTASVYHTQRSLGCRPPLPLPPQTLAHPVPSKAHSGSPQGNRPQNFQNAFHGIGLSPWVMRKLLHTRAPMCAIDSFSVGKPQNHTDGYRHAHCQTAGQLYRTTDHQEPQGTCSLGYCIRQVVHDKSNNLRTQLVHHWTTRKGKVGGTCIREQ